MPDDTPAAVMMRSRSTTRSSSGLAPKSASCSRRDPVAGGVDAVEDARRAEQERAGAHRRREPRVRVHLAEPIDQRVAVAHHPAGDRAAGHDDDLRPRRPRRRFESTGTTTSPRLSATGPGSDGDELHLGVREAGEHVVRADQVEGGEPWEHGEGDVHAAHLCARTAMAATTEE